MHYFITGHTGFKGSWLTLLLKKLGHEVSGYSLPPVEGGLFKLANLEQDLKHNFIGDIRELVSLRHAMAVAKPDFAIHMAAQPLVLRSYEDPIETYTTNVDGTLNFLRAITDVEAPPVSLVITTDKVYRDDGKGSYVETDPLGGHDPYSASKAMGDILSQSWAKTNPSLKLHIARAGNVIGAFDVSENRLMPDTLRAVRLGIALSVRQPQAVRPWQHVLDCLSGYVLLLDKVGLGEKIPLVLNFGPDPKSIKKVSEVIDFAVAKVPGLKYVQSRPDSQIKETELLTLDSHLATSLLGWSNKVDFGKAIDWCFEELSETPAREVAERQIRDFLTLGSLQ